MGILILVLSLTPGYTLPDSPVKFADLIVHVLMYGSWMFTINFEIKKQYLGDSQRFSIRMLFAIVLVGIVIEFLQEYLIPGRFGSFSDGLANSIGAIISYLGFKKYVRFG